MYKVIIISLMVLVGLSGCMSEKAYMTAKVVHAGAKAVYIELPVHSEALENLDSVVISYDTVRTKVKNQISLNKKKEVATTLEVIEK